MPQDMQSKREFLDVEHQSSNDKAWQYQAKKEFNSDEAEVYFDADAELELNPSLEQRLDPYLPLEGELLGQKSTGWKKRMLLMLGLLFGGAVVAQAIQWLVESWQQNQWIYFAFSIAFSMLLLLASGTIFNEWRQLFRLKQLEQIREKSQVLLLEQRQITPEKTEFEQAVSLCETISSRMQLPVVLEKVALWREQLNPAYSADEVFLLFSQIVLQPLDQQAKTLIQANATETTVMVAISPVALVDMLLIAWRNLRLLKRIAQLYGVELGYFSRLRLLKMVLFNIAFAGATELIQEVGMDWLSQDITAKFSARAAQGIGVGLLTARLGIKAVEFCRPIAFRHNEKLKLSLLHQALISQLKQRVFSKGLSKDKNTNKIK